MSQKAFHEKWAILKEDTKDNIKEKFIYVKKGKEPATQRQLSLYNYFRFIEHELKEIDAKDVIEIGCGRGTIGLYLADYCNMNVSLMDNEEGAMKIAREAFKNHNLNAKFIVGDALNMNLPDNSFDAIVSIGLAEHLDNVADLFAEQYRVLRPGGKMVTLNIPKKFSVQHLNTVLRMIKKTLGFYKDAVHRDYYRNAYSAKEYETFAKQVGFTETKVTHVCPFPVLVPIRMTTDKLITKWRKLLLKLRGLVMPYPYKTNRLIAHAHFLVGTKPNNG